MMTNSIKIACIFLPRLLSKPFRMHNQSQIRKMMRGYHFLKKHDKLHIIEDAVQHLRECRLSIPAHSLPKALWGAAMPSAELIIRQHLSSNYLRLNRALLIASSMPKGKVIAALPKVWRGELQQLGFEIGNWQCSLLWKLELFKYACYGTAKAIIVISESVSYKNSNNFFKQNSYIYFNDLVRNNLPADDSDQQSYCVINWYRRWIGKRSDVQVLRHAVPHSGVKQANSFHLEYQKNPIPALYYFKHKLLFICWVLFTLVQQVVSIVLGYWWNLLIYQESVTASLARIQAPVLLAKEYWFHNSRFYPPLWTYELPSKGSEAIFYFYSTNCEPFPRQDETCPFITPYSIMNWPRYIVWNMAQSSFISRCEQHIYSIEAVGPIWFSDVKVASQQLYPTTFLAVFDVPPHRTSYYQAYCMPSNYYSVDISIEFMRVVLDVASCAGIPVVYKAKRNIGKIAHPKYRSFINQCIDSKLLTVCDASLSAFSLVNHASYVVSAPYTSTALIAKNLGKPSIYFDPISIRNSTNSFISEIEIISSAASLHNWLIKNIRQA